MGSRWTAGRGLDIAISQPARRSASTVSGSDRSCFGRCVTTTIPGWQLLLGGLFVGYGARLGGGCASGHGICGIGSFHMPSVVAVLTFMATGLLTANLITRWF